MCTLYSTTNKGANTKMKKIITIEEGFLFLTEMSYQFFMQDLIMHKKGIIYREKQHSYKFEQKLKAILQQMRQLFEKEEKKELIKKLEKMENLLTEKCIESVTYTGGRTIERDYRAISWDISRQYCIFVIEELQGVDKEDWIIKDIEELTIYLRLKTYKDKRIEIKKQKNIKIIREKAITQCLKKKIK
jgi:hypothetical protein